MDKNKIKKLPIPDNWRTFIPRTYLHTEDLMDDKGGYRSLTLTTKEVEAHEIENPKTYKKEPKLVLFFDKGEKGLILNATNSTVLQEMSKSRNPHDWGGLRVELYVELQVSTPQGKKDMPRIRPARAVQAANG